MKRSEAKTHPGKQLALFESAAAPPPEPRSKVPRWWTVKGGAVAKVCPQCGCGKATPCNVHLGGGRFVVCTPAGIEGSRVCSACTSLNGAGG